MDKVVPIDISQVNDLLDYPNDLVRDGLDISRGLCASLKGPVLQIQ
jgi:hypothetical protein